LLQATKNTKPLDSCDTLSLIRSISLRKHKDWFGYLSCNSRQSCVRG